MPTLSIDFTAAQAQRLAAAMEPRLAPGRTPTMTDLKAYVANHFREIVLAHEAEEARKALPAPSSFDPS